MWKGLKNEEVILNMGIWVLNMGVVGGKCIEKSCSLGHQEITLFIISIIIIDLKGNPLSHSFHFLS